MDRYPASRFDGMIIGDGMNEMGGGEGKGKGREGEERRERWSWLLWLHSPLWVRRVWLLSEFGNSGVDWPRASRA